MVTIWFDRMTQVTKTINRCIRKFEIYYYSKIDRHHSKRQLGSHIPNYQLHLTT